VDALSVFADSLYHQIVQFVGAVTAIGLVVMAVIQSVKDMFPIRRWFHRRFVQAWLDHKASESRGPDTPSPTRAGADLVLLATTGDDEALFDLPVEQMCGQVAAAAAQSLDYPARHKDLLRCLAASADPRDVNLVLTSAEQARAEVEQADEETRMALVDARTRVMHQVQRSVDALQIAAGYRWKWYMQLTAFLLSYTLTVIAVLLVDNGDSILRRLVVAIPLGIIGGFVAPVARDLVATWTHRG